MFINKPAPDFALPDETGRIHHLKDYRDQFVLLYFYPKDMTSGCTTQAQCFRDSLNDFQAHNVQVLGVSADSVASHKKFKEAHHLNFPLLSDPEKEVIQKYDVWKEKSMYGKKYMGIQRDSFHINPEGIIIKHYQKVKPSKHAAEVLKDLKGLQN